MTVARSYFLLAVLFLIGGICLGMYMGGSQDFRLKTVHAHVNLLGFVLLMIFGLVYHTVPSMAQSSLARVQLWLHIIGALGLLLMLTLYFLGRISDSVMPLAPLFEVAVLLGVLVFLANLWRNYRAA